MGSFLRYEGRVSAPLQYRLLRRSWCIEGSVAPSRRSNCLRLGSLEGSTAPPGVDKATLSGLAGRTGCMEVLLAVGPTKVCFTRRRVLTGWLLRVGTGDRSGFGVVFIFQTAARYAALIFDSHGRQLERQRGFQFFQRQDSLGCKRLNKVRTINDVQNLWKRRVLAGAMPRFANA